MINVQRELKKHLKDTYSYTNDEQIKEKLKDFLKAIPSHIIIDEGQYAAIERWIDTNLQNNNYLPQDIEIAILTYINSCERKTITYIVKWLAGY